MAPDQDDTKTPGPERHLFVSQRERRLWMWTIAVVVAIYSTLGLARVLADELRRRELFDTVFVLCFLLILMAIVALGVKARPGGLEIGVALGVVAVYTLVFVRMAIPEERSHVVEYGVVAILLHEALVERGRQDDRIRSPAVIAFGLAFVVGTVDEVIQLFLPSRIFDWNDIWTNAISAGLALAAKLGLGWASKRRLSR